MTRRKPPGVHFESWIDRQIRLATERGDFKDLPGSGEPLADLDKPYDEMWWVNRKLRQENLTYLPPSLALRKEAHEAVEGAARAATEEEVRERIAAVNDKIRDAIRMGIRGPQINLAPFDVERIVGEWRRGGGVRASNVPALRAKTPNPPAAERGLGDSGRFDG